jgi:hypothetical protein
MQGKGNCPLPLHPIPKINPNTNNKINPNTNNKINPNTNSKIKVVYTEELTRL